MKKLLLLFITSMLVFSACSNEENKPVDDKNKYAFDTTDVKTEPLENPNETFTLAYKFEKGKKYLYRLTAISKDDATIKADTTINQNVRQTLVYLLEFSPVEVDGDGTMELDVIFNGIKVDAQANGQNYRYEAGVTKDSAEIVKYADYEALYKNGFTLRVTKRGEIVEIFRADKLANRYLELKGYADSLNAEQKGSVKKNIIDGAVRPLLTQIFRPIPTEPIAKDSAWFFAQPESQLMAFSLRNINLFKVSEYAKIGDDKVAVIDAGLETQIAGNPKVNDRGINYNFKKPETKADGKIYFNVSKGQVMKSRTHTTVSIYYTMEGMTQRGRIKGDRKEFIENTNIVEAL